MPTKVKRVNKAASGAKPTSAYYGSPGPTKSPGSVGQFGEIGSTGLLRTGIRGVVYEEFLKDLWGERARRIYREMRDNDAAIGAMFFAFEMVARNVDWRVEGDNQEQVDFIKEVMEDMGETWEDFIVEVLSMLTFGFSWHEIILKRRNGTKGNDQGAYSRFTDGKIGWRKLPIRAQETLLEWEWNDVGDVQNFVQVAPPMYNRIEIPIERSLLFRTGQHKNNPEGRSLLRNVYRSWLFKKHIEEVEGIGIERDLAGMPVIYRTAEIAAKHDEKLKEILLNVRRDEQEGVLLPLAWDEKGNKQLTFELLVSGSRRQFDVHQVIDRYNKTITMTMMADFIMLGQQQVGSFALASSKTELFGMGVGAILKSIASVMNRIAIPRLLEVNGMKTDDPPKMVPGDTQEADLKELGGYITALAGAGAPLFPDNGLEDYLRGVADLPLKPEDSMALPTPPKNPLMGAPGSAVPGAQNEPLAGAPGAVPDAGKPAQVPPKPKMPLNNPGKPKPRGPATR